MGAGYYAMDDGSCDPAGLITDMDECKAAVTALGITYDYAYDYYYSTSTSYPAGCFRNDYVEYLYVYGAASTGSCSSTHVCLCKFTPT